MTTLGDRFDPRRNSFDVLRLSFALLVAIDHGIGIRTGEQWRWGLSTLGDFGLDGFFILSGFLITRSFLTLESFPRFVWHRFLRIAPGFWVCLLVTTFVVAPLVLQRRFVRVVGVGRGGGSGRSGPGVGVVDARCTRRACWSGRRLGRG
ncbi:Acyltransferase family protein [Pseudonocardia ammonioxydans]|uniref:Acyltransferase family protein n=2 Tax=Pseudonocardia ammonioxydans TaxID=260086 RepID=A0A1I5IVB2_PSUAM|nr:Acyltransferase family protein [Pseudonocardia ammonioxydans]